VGLLHQPEHGIVVTTEKTTVPCPLAPLSHRTMECCFYSKKQNRPAALATKRFAENKSSVQFIL